MSTPGSGAADRPAPQGFAGRSLAVVAMNSTVAASGLLFWLIAARMLPAPEVGVGAPLLAAAQTVGAFSTLGLGIALVRFLPEGGARNRSMLSPALTLSALCGLAGAAPVALLAPVAVPSLGVLHTIAGFLGFAALAAAYSIGFVLLDLLVAARRPDLAVQAALIQNIPRLVLLVALAPLGVAGLIAATLLPQFAMIGAALRSLGPRALPGWRFSPTLSAAPLRPALGFAAVNLAAAFLVLLPQALLPLWVLRSSGAEAAAYFSVAWVLAGVLSTIPTSVSVAALADASAERARTRGIVRRSLLVASLLVLAGVAAAVALAAPLLGLLGDAYRIGGATTLVYLALATPALVLQHVAITLARLERSTLWQLLLPTVPFMLLVPLLAAGTGPGAGGGEAVAIAWFISQVAALPLYAIAIIQRTGRQRQPVPPQPTEPPI